MGLRKKVNELRQKPYRERVKILWTLVAAAAAVILIIWFLTLQFREVEKNSESSKLKEIFENIKQLKNLNNNGPA